MIKLLKKYNKVLIPTMISITFIGIFLIAFSEITRSIRIYDPFNIIVYWGSILSAISSVLLINISRPFQFSKEYRYTSILLILTLFFISKIPLFDTHILKYFFTLGIFIFSTTLLIDLFKIQPKNKKPTKEIRTRYIYLGLILLLILSFIFRIYNLDKLSPSVDEYFHIIGAQKNNLLGFYNYQRGFFVTEIISVMFKIFGKDVFWARLPGVILGTVNTFLIFKIGSHFNKKIGLLSSYLFAIAPFCIGIARYAREYEYTLFLFSLILLLLLNYIRDHKEARKIKDYISWEIILILFIDILLILFYFFKEKSGAVVEILGMEAIVLGIGFYSRIIDVYKGLNGRQKVIIPIMITLFGTFVGLFLLKNYAWAINTFRVNADYLNMLFDPGWDLKGFIPLWYSGISFIPQTLIILIFIYPISRLNKNTNLSILYLVFLFTITPFVFLSDRYFGPRYIYFSFMPFIVIMAYSITLIYKDFLSENRLQKGIFLILFLCLFSPYNTILGLVSEDPTISDPKTRLSHYDPEMMLEGLYSLGYTDGDYVITTRSDNFTFMNDNPTFITNDNKDEYPLKRLYYYAEDALWYDYNSLGYYVYKNNDTGIEGEYATSYGGFPCEDNVCTINEKQRISKLMHEHETGWLVIDKDRNRLWNSNGFERKTMFTANSEINFLGSTEGNKGYDIFIWKPINNEK